MTFSFNLVDEKWIPCLWQDGRAEEMSLRETLANAHLLWDVHGATPLETAALYRLLLVILHRAFGPANVASWKALYSAGQCERSKLEAYWKKWRHRFDHFDKDRPFYQADDRRVSPKSIISLVLEMASGNNAALFDHHTETEGASLTSAEAACAVLAAQAFGIGGLSGLPDKFTDAPCAKGIVFFAQGSSLFETLMFNLAKYPDDSGPMPSDEDDCPAWEMDDSFKPKRTQPKGYLDYLTWQNRRILLLPEESPAGVIVRQMKWAPGLRLEGNEIDPMKRYLKDEKGEGWRVLQFDMARSLWRDSATLFTLNDPDHIKPPRAFRWLATLVREGALPAERNLRFVALGMSKNQAKIEFLRAETFPLPLDYLKENDVVTRLGDALDRAEKAAGWLRGATLELGREILEPHASAGKMKKEERERAGDFIAPWGIDSRYWSGLELPFRRLLEGLPREPERAEAEWKATLRRAVEQAFAQAVRYAGEDTRARKAAVTADRLLRHGLREVLGEPEFASVKGGTA
ncbi:MAG: type I-E CRISPR-associated protein Cse1/CasA [Burkholderiales bacterium]